MVPRSFWIALTLLIAAPGCSGSHLATSAVPAAETVTARLPDVAQKGKGAQWVMFLPKTVSSAYSAIVTGPDAQVWFIDENSNALARIGETGAVKEFALTGATGNAVSLAVGADKAFYILDESANVLRATTAGAVTVIPLPSGDQTSIDGIARGPDGNVWFAEFNHIGKITPSGKITEYAYPAGYTTNQYGGVTTGADGNVWFAQSSGNAIGRVVPSTGTITMFTIPIGCTPAPVVLGNDGNVWFACLTSAANVGSITPSGTIATYPIGGTFSSNETEQFCARGPDGEPWCASGNDNTVFRINTAAHTVTTFTPPLSAGARPDAVTAGPDGNLWMDTAGGTGDIDVLVTSPIAVKPNVLTFASTGQSATLTVSESGTTHWTAVSSDTAVASVVAGGTNTTFTVTSAGAGTCKITISDGAGNSVAVKVTVT